MTGVFLFFIGLFSGGYGIMVGAGGGFVFVPALLILLNLSPEGAAGTGLVVVFINALSGVFGYVRQHRVYYKIGVILAIGATPGTILGVWMAHIVSTIYFYWIFAIVLVALGLFLLIKKSPKKKLAKKSECSMETAAGQDHDDEQKDKKTTGILLSVGVLLGLVSSFFGIGGGWLLVPILIYVFRMSPHYATATSIFSLCLYSAVGVLIHIGQGNVDWMVVLWGGLGILAGAQIGVFLSNKLSGERIMQMLSVILIVVGVKLFFQ